MPVAKGRTRTLVLGRNPGHIRGKDYAIGLCIGLLNFIGWNRAHLQSRRACQGQTITNQNYESNVASKYLLFVESLVVIEDFLCGSRNVLPWNVNNVAAFYERSLSGSSQSPKSSTSRSFGSPVLHRIQWWQRTRLLRNGGIVFRSCKWHHREQIGGRVDREDVTGREKTASCWHFVHY